MTTFKTHKGDIVTGERLVTALHKVACDMETNVLSVYESDPYASHVTTAQKIENLQRDYNSAEDVRNGKNLHNFTIWQRVNTELTGECVGLLS